MTIGAINGARVLSGVLNGVPTAWGVVSQTVGADTVVSSGYLLIAGVGAPVQGADTLTTAGGGVLAGQVSYTQGAQTLITTGGPRVIGTLSKVQGAHTVVSSGLRTIIQHTTYSAVTGHVGSSNISAHSVTNPLVIH